MHLYEFDFLSAIMKILIQNRSSWKLGLMNHCNLGFQTSLNLTWSQITLLTRYFNVIKLIYVDCIYDHINPRYISCKKVNKTLTNMSRNVDMECSRYSWV